MQRLPPSQKRIRAQSRTDERSARSSGSKNTASFPVAALTDATAAAPLPSDRHAT